MTMETIAGTPYDHETRCLSCGATESDTPGVTVTEHEVEERNPRRSLLEQTWKTYECHACGATSHQKGVVESGDWGYVRVPLDWPKMVIKVGETEVQFRQAEAFVVETERFDLTGFTNGGRNRHVIIWAFESPTFSKGSAYRVQLGDFLDERMLLVGIRYYTSDDPWRRLHFTRGLSHGVLDTIERLADDGGEAP